MLTASYAKPLAESSTWYMRYTSNDCVLIGTDCDWINLNAHITVSEKIEFSVDSSIYCIIVSVESNILYTLTE